VGVVHAVLARLAPYSPRVDLTHGIPAHDVRAGALTLWRAAPWLAGGVILAVVDPGVATDRRAVAVRTGDGTFLVGPDNGLLFPAAHALHSVTAAVELEVTRRHTFAGRDVFAPAAAALASGQVLERLGTAIDPASIHGDPVAVPAAGDGRIEAEVLWVDRFGNAQLNLAASVAGPGPLFIGGRRLRIVDSFAAIGNDPFGLVVDSYGYLAICCDRAPAAERLGLGPGDRVDVGLPGSTGTI
jgi:S-adenosylmethionine hydrolase